MRAFFDTNILVYLHDTGEPMKSTVARELFQKCAGAGEFVVSTQVLQELWVTAARKFSNAAAAVRELIKDLIRLDVVVTQPEDILNAIHWQLQWKISFRDALILVSAKRAGASVLYSEDLTHGRSYNGVKVSNPFLPLGN